MQKLLVTGAARVFATSLTVRTPVASGQRVDLSDLDTVEAEWTHLHGQALQSWPNTQPLLAARS